MLNAILILNPYLAANELVGYVYSDWSCDHVVTATAVFEGLEGLSTAHFTMHLDWPHFRSVPLHSCVYGLCR